MEKYIRLRDKKTGKIVKFDNIGLNNDVDRSDGTDDDVFFALKEHRFNSLAELCERFEDAPEEIKPFEEVAKVNHELQLYAGSRDEFITRDGCKQKSFLRIADIDYYEILPDGTKKTEFTWDEAMEIEKKTHGKWRVPTVPEWFAICAAFGRTKDGTDVDPQILREKLGLTADEDGYGGYWSAGSYSDSNSYYLYFVSSRLYPRGNGYKGYGFAVRCVAGKGE